MTTAYLLDDIEKDEEYARALPDGSCTSYPDPRTGGDPWTIGWGHTGPEVHPGLIWTRAQAYAALMADVANVHQELDHALSWWRQMNDARQDVLVNVTFNMGLTHLLGFKNALAAMERADWPDAAAELLDSAWANEVGHRAIRLAQQMHDGVRIPA